MTRTHTDLVAWALILSSMILLASPHLAAQPNTTVSPRARARLEGSTSTLYPLGRAQGRFQQLFSDLTSPQLLRGHAYRRDAVSGRGQIAAFVAELSVKLSTATTTPAQPSKTFAQNHGASPTTVLPKTLLTFKATTAPTSAPAATFPLRIPYKTPFSWSGKGSLCLEVVLHSNIVGSSRNRNFSADLDAHELFASGRNLQPGFRFGNGCTAAGSRTPAWARFVVRHLGKTSDLSVQAAQGVPSTTTAAAESVLVLGFQKKPIAWPPGTGCTLYVDPVAVLYLPGKNDSRGRWTGIVPLGQPLPAHTTAFGQVISLTRQLGQVVLSNASQLTMPPPGPGLVSVRIAHGTSPTATTGTISYSVPVTLFF